MARCKSSFSTYVPSPTRNCHSGPSGCDNVLLVSMAGSTAFMPLGPRPPTGYRGGGGRTLREASVSKRTSPGSLANSVGLTTWPRFRAGLRSMMRFGSRRRLGKLTKAKGGPRGDGFELVGTGRGRVNRLSRSRRRWCRGSGDQVESRSRGVILMQGWSRDCGCLARTVGQPRRFGAESGRMVCMRATSRSTHRTEWRDLGKEKYCRIQVLALTAIYPWFDGGRTCPRRLNTLSLLPEPMVWAGCACRLLCGGCGLQFMWGSDGSWGG